jgi:Outer membrane protein beta-barrel domain
MKNTFFSVLLVAVFATFSFAQSTDDYKKGEFFVGYSPIVLDAGSGGDRQTFQGVNVSGVYNVSKYVGIKGDFSTHHKNISQRFGTTNITLNASVQNFLAGVQIKNNSTEGRVKPFAHALIGAGRIKAGANFAGTNTSSSQNGLSLAFGGGLDVRVNKRISIRVIQADYNPIRINGETTNNVRLGFGIVF